MTPRAQPAPSPGFVTDAAARLAPSDSFWRQAARRLRRRRPAMFSLAALLAMALLALFAPALSPYAYDAQDFNIIGNPQAPSRVHPMGTDQLGRDSFSRILHGGRVSLSVGLLSALMAALIGTVVGAAAGYYGGTWDTLLMRAVDLALSIPILPMMIVLAGIFRPSIALLIVIIGSFGWMGTARLVRSRFLSLRTAEYVEASHALGGGASRVIFLHMLPNALGPIVVATTLAVGNAIMLESALSFLGLGVQPPRPTWGNLLYEARDFLSLAPWMAVFPGLFILVTVLAVNFLGDGLRDALDPKT